MIVRPRSVGTFLMSRRPTSANPSARSVMRSMSERSRSPIASRFLIITATCLSPRTRGLRPLCSAPSSLDLSHIGDRHLVDLVQLLDPDVDPLLRGGGQVLAHVVGADRQLAVAAVNEDRELHLLGTAVVEQGVDRRPHRTAGEQDVVDEYHGAPIQVEVEV